MFIYLKGRVTRAVKKHRKVNINLLVYSSNGHSDQGRAGQG